MGRLDLPDRYRDEDADTTRRGGKRRSQYRTIAESFTHAELVARAEAGLVIGNALELLSRRERVDGRTLRNLADVLRAGLT